MNHKRLRFTRNLNSEEAYFDASKVLAGLAPKLVITLAQLVGQSLEDLQVTIQLLPWGDRATLAAYGAITMDDNTGPGRKVRALPACEELTYAAAELVAEAVEPGAVARLLDASAESPHTEEPRVNLEVATNSTVQNTDDLVQVAGVVRKVDKRSGGPVYTVVMETPRTGLRGPETLFVSPQGKLRARKDSKVWVAFKRPDVLGEPLSITVDPSFADPAKQVS